MPAHDDEAGLLRSVALHNARAILLARRRAEEELVRAKEALETELIERRRAEALMACQKQAFEMATSGAALIDVLQFLARAVEAESQPGTVLAIHLLDASGTRFAETAAPSLPASYAEGTNGMLVASAARPCCAAVARRERVAVSDLAVSEEFAVFAAFALPLGIRAASSTPIISSAGKVVGTAANYYTQPRQQQRRDDLLEQIVTHTAAVIIERENAERARRESDARFRDMADHAPVMVWVTEADATCTFLSKSWYDFTGQTAETGLGFGWVEAVYPDDRTAARETLVEAHTRRAPFSLEYRLRRKDGEYRWALDSARPRFDSSGLFLGYIGSVIDIDERKRMEEARARLAAIVESSDDVIVGKTLEGVITAWNRAAEKLFGYTAAEAVGQHITLIIPEERRAEEDEVLARLRCGEKVEHFETVRRAKDGRRIDISLTVSPVRDANGRIIGTSKVARDITERKRSEAALRESERRFASLAELVPQLVWTTRPDGSADYFNQRWYDYTGQTSDEALGHGWAQALHPDDRERPGEWWQHALRTGEMIEVEYRLRDSHGRYQWFLARAAPLKNDRGDVEKWFGTCTNIENQKRLEAALQEADRRKDEFLATLSHELRTPLNSMLGWMRMLRSGTLDETTAQRALEVVERNVKHQSRLITDLLDISRIVWGKLSLEKAVIDFKAVVTSVVDTMRPAAEAKAIALTADVGAHSLPVHGDAERLRQVVANVLSNAVKFTPTGGSVAVRLLRVGRGVRVTVSDTGKGINPEFLPHVFERFSQADSGSVRAQAGLGIGLAIVRHLVELHEGRVKAESLGEGKGATFIIDLPLTDPASVSVDALEDSLVSADPLSNLRGVRVLIIDDDRDTRDLFTAILGQQGAEVTAVAGAREGLAAARRARPDVVLCDLAMPGADGFAFIREIRSWPSDQGGPVPAVALSAYARLEDRERALAAGFRLHVPKPVEPRELMEAVARLVRRRS